MPNSSTDERPPFREALKFWFKLGWISFGGTAGHIALMHDFLVDKKKWISNSRFFHALSICMLLPGPEAQQLAIYIGQQLHGKKGGLVAGLLFILPSTFILLGLSIIYALYGDVPVIYALFNGLKPAVIALIIIALIRVGQKSLKGWLHYAVSAVAFVCIFVFNLSLLFIIIGTILLAVCLRYFFPKMLKGDIEAHEKEAGDEAEYYINRFSAKTGADFKVKDLAIQLTVFLAFWLFPFLALYFLAGDFTFWKGLILFFTQTAFFTIGGSYTVLPYVAQFAVGRLNWLSKTQMVDGFALAETTPGPLIIVVAFVGFMAGFNHFHASLIMGSLALFITVYYMFLPCFLYIFSGGPLIEKSHSSNAISEILQLVTAAVVGVILNLTLFLGKAVVFKGPVSVANVDFISLGWVLLSLFLLLKFKINVIYLLLLSLLFGGIRFFFLAG